MSPSKGARNIMPAKKASRKTVSKKSISDRVKTRQATQKAVTKKAATKQPAAKRATSAARTVLVVNMIPRSLSGEEHQDSEPTIAVNPANPLQIAASAFTPDPAAGPRAPIFVSTD